MHRNHCSFKHTSTLTTTRFGGALLRAPVNQALTPGASDRASLQIRWRRGFVIEGVRALRVAHPLPEIAGEGRGGRRPEKRRVSLAGQSASCRGREQREIDEIINEK